jgi:Ca2+-binding EF-hand superfamily protein
MTDEIEEIFTHFDKDKSGAIDVRELDALMQALGADLDQAELDAAITALDTDRNGVIDLDEFRVWWSDR